MQNRDGFVRAGNSSEDIEARLPKLKKNHGEEHIDQKIRARNVEARNERIETGAVVQDRRDKRGVARELRECYQWKAEGQCSKRDN